MYIYADTGALIITSLLKPIKLVQTIDTYHKRSHAYIYIFKPTYLPWGALVGDRFPDKDEESLLP